MTVNTQQEEGRGAAFPPANPGPSWNVPRVSLPGLFGLQPPFAMEWWYYVGTVITADGTLFSLQLQIIRATVNELTIAYGITGIGTQNSGVAPVYTFGQGLGFGAGTFALANNTLLPNSLVVPCVSDNAFSAVMTPWFEITGYQPDHLPQLKLNFPAQENWNFSYQGGGMLGCINAIYQLNASGNGYSNAAGSAATLPQTYSISLQLQDERGTVMEGACGYVGPAMFASSTGDAPASYECAQPFLNVTGGQLQTGNETHVITGGNLWMDRQMVASAPDSATAAVAQNTAPPDSEAALLQFLLSSQFAARPLYVGNWMALSLHDGTGVALAEFWQPALPGEKQWITGNKVNKPPLNAFGNLYYAAGSSNTTVQNGGYRLLPKIDGESSEWDFDVNILNSAHPNQSPHYTSALSGNTYATAWEISFSPSLLARMDSLPPVLYLFAICENCENVPPRNIGAFFEGAALVYADKERREPKGYAFVEQMGFN